LASSIVMLSACSSIAGLVKKSEDKAPGPSQQFADREAETRLQESLDVTLRGWARTLQETAKPVTAEELAKYDADVKALGALRPDAPLYFNDRRWDVEVHNAWFLGDASANELARLHGAQVEVSGTAQKKFKQSIEAQAGKCYALLIRWSEPGTTGDIGGTWSTAKNQGHLHGFSLREGDGRAPSFCAYQAMTATFDGTLAGNGKATYHVIRWAKAEVTMPVALRIHGADYDRCDPVAVRDRLLDPMPGLVYYNDGRPMSLAQSTGTGGSDLNFEFQTKAPQTWKFAAEWSAPKDWAQTCSGVSGPTGTLSQQLFACVAGVDRQFASKHEAAVKAYEAANILAKDAAGQRADAILTQWDAAKDKRCYEPIGSKIQTEMTGVMGEVAEHYRSKRPEQLDVRGLFVRMQQASEVQRAR
jgi:hypothetical protein